MRIQLGEFFRSLGVALAMCGMLMLPATIVGCAERDADFMDPQPPATEPGTDPGLPGDTPGPGIGEPADPPEGSPPRDANDADY